MRLRGQAVKTSPFHGGNTGSIPVGVTQIIYKMQDEQTDFDLAAQKFIGIYFDKAFADVAQLAEQLICNQQVIGSSPIIGFVLLDL